MNALLPNIYSEIIHLRKWQFLLSCGKSLLAFWANVIELRIAIRKHIALDDTGIPQTCSFTTSGTIDVCFRYGSTSGTKNIFLHDRHLSFYVIFRNDMSRVSPYYRETSTVWQKNILIALIGPTFLIMARGS
jgi:hypothetical protein